MKFHEQNEKFNTQIETVKITTIVLDMKNITVLKNPIGSFNIRLGQAEESVN